MSYKDLGYSALLLRQTGVDLSRGINESNVDAIVGDGVISGSIIDNDEDWTDDTTADAAQATADAAQAAVLLKATIFRQDGEPTAGESSSGDIWIDTNDGDRPYTYNGSAWVETLTVIDGGKITTGTIDASIVTVNNIVAGNITAGTLNVDRILAGSIVSSKVGSDLTDANITSINFNNITASNISATNINTGTLTGIIIKTAGGSYPAAKMDSNGVTVHGQNFTVKEAGGNTIYGYIGGYGGYYNFNSYNNRNIKINAGSGYIFIDSDLRPITDEGASLGSSSYRFLNVHSVLLNIESFVTLGGCVSCYGGIQLNNCNITPYSDYTCNIGTTSDPFNSMCASSFYFKTSSLSSKYITRSSSGLDINCGVYIGGALSKASGSFKIDHPLKPKTHWLEHSFVESPDMLNLYTGNAQIKKGKCKIKMPNWFIPLNGKNDDDFTFQLTSLGQQNDLWVKEKMNEKGEVIFAGEKDGKFSYMITAIRHDKWAENHRVKVESKKVFNLIK